MSIRSKFRELPTLLRVIIGLPIIAIAAVISFGMNWGIEAIVIPFVAVWVILAVLPIAGTRRIHAEWLKRSQMCVKCRYPLRDLQASGQCPECGTAFGIASKSEGQNS